MKSPPHQLDERFAVADADRSIESAAPQFARSLAHWRGGKPSFQVYRLTRLPTRRCAWTDNSGRCLPKGIGGSANQGGGTTGLDPVGIRGATIKERRLAKGGTRWADEYAGPCERGRLDGEPSTSPKRLRTLRSVVLQSSQRSFELTARNDPKDEERLGFDRAIQHAVGASSQSPEHAVEAA